MVASKIDNILLPKITKLKDSRPSDIESNKNLEQGVKFQDELKNLLKEKIGEVKENHGINLSIHAAKRMHERNIDMDSGEYLKLKNAITKLKEKGGQESLVITDKGAYIVDVGGSKIITAIDKNDMCENVFTKIDSTLII